MSGLPDVARRMFLAAVAAVQPDALVRRLAFTPTGVAFGDDVIEPAGRLVLVALGKAAPGLAAAFLARCRRQPDQLFVLAPEGVPVPDAVAPATRAARHPLPDERGVAATAELRALLAALDARDGVVVLLSGGGSALLAEPLPGVALERVVAVTLALLRAGATINELNAVRKHLLAGVGGRLAAACPAPMLTLALSDVPGDDLATIASGPTVGDPTTLADAAAVLRRHGLEADFADLIALWGNAAESPKPGDPRLERATTRLLGTSREALEAAAGVARDAGLLPRVVTRTLRGEAREIGRTLAALARAGAAGEGVVLLFAGETTVTVAGHGRGGRNLEVALAAALALDGMSDRCVLAAGTDGVDGNSPAAGAVVDGDTAPRARLLGRDPDTALADNDAWGFFAGLPEAIVTGPTGTNVADLAFALVAGAVPLLLSDAAAAALALGGRAGAPPGAAKPDDSVR
ncbi:MAG: glycerate kinase [Acidobacteria bacterium]|nr:glycerate kinase [Acidobacteriota bacterium]